MSVVLSMPTVFHFFRDLKIDFRAIHSPEKSILQCSQQKRHIQRKCQHLSGAPDIIVTRLDMGNHRDLETIPELYMPMIEHNSYLYDRLDENLKQYILIPIALNISRFKI